LRCRPELGRPSYRVALASSSISPIDIGGSADLGYGHTLVIDDHSSRCALLGDAWTWWAATLETMDADAWTRPTRLEGWDVAALVAHHSLLVTGIGFLATQPLDGEPATASARDMLRRFNAPDGVATTAADAVAEMARQMAGTMSRADVIGKFVVEAPSVVAGVREAGPIVIDYFGNGAFPIAEAVAIAIMEAVVHGLDLADAIGAAAGELPDGPVRFTTELLANLADPVEFIESATGRRLPDVLPVLH
jgi:uncharacterized protein (TIGR03083 family)